MKILFKEIIELTKSIFQYLLINNIIMYLNKKLKKN